MRFGRLGDPGRRERRGAVICVREPALSDAGTVNTLLVLAPRVAPSGRRFVPASMRSECLHAGVDASIREDVGTPPLAVMLPCPAMRPLQLTIPCPLSVALALALTLQSR